MKSAIRRYVHGIRSPGEGAAEVREAAPSRRAAAAEAKPWPGNFAEAFDPRRNSFGALRFFFAALVLYSHSFPLGGLGTDPVASWSHQQTSGGLAVVSFFILSGFLITRSYERTSSLPRFLWHRALRILPGYWACLAVTAFAIGPIVWYLDRGTMHGYLTGHPQSPLNHIKANFFLWINQYGINELLARAPFPYAFNGSLWTLYYEVKCYLAVGVLGFVGVLSRSKQVVTWIFFALLALTCLDTAVPGAAAKVMPYFLDASDLKLSTYFAAGAAFFLNSKQIPFSRRYFFAACGLMLFGLKYPCFPLVTPLVMPYILFWLAFRLPMHWFDKYGDFSYGLYIYAFPMQQLVTYFRLNRWGMAPYFTISLAATLVLAVLSYFCVERPFLRLKDWRGPFPGLRSRSLVLLRGTHRVASREGSAARPH